MNSNILIVAAAGIGILAGAGGTYLIMPEPEPVVRAPTDAEIAALIAANPSLIPEPPAPVLEIPTEEEALAAYRKAYARNPLRTGRGKAWRFFEKLEWSGTLPSSPRRQNQRYARLRWTSSQSRRSERIPME